MKPNVSIFRAVTSIPILIFLFYVIWINLGVQGIIFIGGTFLVIYFISIPFTFLGDYLEQRRIEKEQGSTPSSADIEKVRKMAETEAIQRRPKMHLLRHK